MSDPTAIAEPFVHRQLWETVADHLRKQITNGVLPAGTLLIETDLAERYRVSRGPVRDALKVLAREGLVLDLPRRGTLVCTLTQSDLVEVIELREALERLAVRDVASRHDRGELSRIRARLNLLEAARDNGDLVAAVAADLDFHREIHRSGQNRRLLNFFEQLAPQASVLIRTSAATDPARFFAYREKQHRELVKALEAGDVDRAQDAVTIHYRNALERLFGGLDVSGGVADVNQPQAPAIGSAAPGRAKPAKSRRR